MTGFVCMACGHRHPLGCLLGGCPDCGGALDVTYAFDPDDRLQDLRRHLPVSGELVSLGEGGTPLLELAAGLHVKDESRNPTHSFKARNNAVAVSMARQFGMEKVVCTSTGNHGVALAAYAARAGMRCLVLLPGEAPAGVAAELRHYGAHAVRVAGGDVLGLMTRLWRDHGWYISQRNTPGVPGRPFGNPFGVEGYKAVAFEIFRQLGGQVPDAVFVPVGGGDGLYGVWKGFVEIRAVGLAERVPRMVACQSAAGAPLVEAWARGARAQAPVPSGPTVALSIVDRLSGDHALRAVHESGGAAVAVTDAEILAAGAELGRFGLCLEPSSAATLAAYRKVPAAGTAVLVGTGTGLRWPATLPGGDVPEVAAEIAALAKVVPL